MNINKIYIKKAKYENNICKQKHIYIYIYIYKTYIKNNFHQEKWYQEIMSIKEKYRRKYFIILFVCIHYNIKSKSKKWNKKNEMHNV